MRHILPAEKPSQKMYEYEGYTLEDMIKDNQKRGEYNK